MIGEVTIRSVKDLPEGAGFFACCGFVPDGSGCRITAYAVGGPFAALAKWLYEVESFMDRRKRRSTSP